MPAISEKVDHIQHRECWAHPVYGNDNYADQSQREAA